MSHLAVLFCYSRLNGPELLINMNLRNCYFLYCFYITFQIKFFQLVLPLIDQKMH